jgi:putative membrane protein
MSSFLALLTSTDVAGRSRAVRVVAVVLAVLTPLLIAGIAVTAIGKDVSTNSDGAPNLPAAVVNLDLPIQTTIDGKQVPVVAGKLLTTQLISENTTGFSWTITDAYASRGTSRWSMRLLSRYRAIFLHMLQEVGKPVQTQLSVQTNGANSYVAELRDCTRGERRLCSRQPDPNRQRLRVSPIFTPARRCCPKHATAASGASQLQRNAAGSRWHSALNTAQQLSSGLHDLEIPSTYPSQRVAGFGAKMLRMEHSLPSPMTQWSKRLMSSCVTMP